MSTFAKVIVGALLLACVLVGLRIAVARMGLLPQLTPEQLSAIELMSQRLASDKPDGYSALHVLLFDIPADERERLEQLDAVSLAAEIKRRGFRRADDESSELTLCRSYGFDESFYSCLDVLAANTQTSGNPPVEIYATAEHVYARLRSLYRYTRFDGSRFESPDEVDAIADLHPGTLDTCRKVSTYHTGDNGTEVRNEECWFRSTGEAHDKLDDELLTSLGAAARIHTSVAFNEGKFDDAVDSACTDAGFWRAVFADANSIHTRELANRQLAADGALLIDMNLRAPADAVVDDACLAHFRPRSFEERDLCEVERGEYRIDLRDHRLWSTADDPNFRLGPYIEWNPHHAAALAATYHAPACRPSSQRRAAVAVFGIEADPTDCSETARFWDAASCDRWADHSLDIVDYFYLPPPNYQDHFYLRAINATIRINSRPAGISLDTAFHELPDEIKRGEPEVRAFRETYESELPPPALIMEETETGPILKYRMGTAFPLRPDQ